MSKAEQPKKVPAPRLRFKQFEGMGEWEEVTLGDITQVVSQRNKHDEKLPIYSISNTDGFVPQSDQFDGVDSHERGYDVSLYKVVNSKTFAYNPARINVGSIGYSGKIERVLISSLYVCFKTTDVANDRFLWNFLKSETFLKAVNDMAEGGIRNYLFYEKFAKIKLHIPPLPEQTHIAAALSSLDAVIDAHTDKLDALRQHKRALMQQLFPQEGEKVPRLRFPEFEGNGEWEEKEVGEVFTVTRGLVLSMTLVSDKPDLEKKYPVYSSQTKNKGLAGYYSDYLYQDAITWTTDGANAGDTNYREGKFYCTNVCGVLLNSEGYANLFVAELLNTVTRNHVSYVGNPKLMNGVMSKIKIPLPTLPEQQRIAACLSSLDDLITAQSEKIDELKTFKRGLMQGLFPSTNHEAAE